MILPAMHGGYGFTRRCSLCRLLTPRVLRIGGARAGVVPRSKASKTFWTGRKCTGDVQQ